MAYKSGMDRQKRISAKISDETTIALGPIPIPPGSIEHMTWLMQHAILRGHITLALHWAAQIEAEDELPPDLRM